MSSTNSPLIEQISWGQMKIQGLGNGKDFKLWPGGGRSWDWCETGTHHEPGIQVADIEELLDHGASCIVLSRGMMLRLKTCPQTLHLLEYRDLAVQVAETRKAVRIYNRLVDQQRSVAGLFHSTC